MGGTVCPQVEIGLIDLPNSGGGGATALPVPTSLEWFFIFRATYAMQVYLIFICIYR